MNASYLSLSYWDVGLAGLFLVLNAGLSIWLRLGLARQIAVAAGRMVVQLLLIGLLLKAIFAIQSPWLTAGVGLAMIGFASREVWARQERKLRGPWGFALGGAAMALAATLVIVVGLSALIQPQPWWSPRFALPLFGMILGNALTGVSLALDTLSATLDRERRAVEAQLLLGATRWRALRPVTRRALRSGMMPIINSMAATGVVSLPGMMSGQILSGVDPTEAVKYQLLIMFLIGGATGLGVLLAVLGGVRRLTDARHRLRLDRLRAASPEAG
ncbi:putative ABC transport system permease protein [Tistlia consotensis]|uniref:Putative ABC transport system permease protein n=1 Tax=Tistlia consotensis USBA 355 TaxID=560819 RepID=A0A1Y6CBY4_9PROT|nr:iron export ABC transporter permease subunit FetB [Tistlia consotensis]SMF54142.1 putative ABC transport system permease protein [Tistlia consotensis USBA 355]SNR86609.1 putative ABC transport system permease protein [Tistlia consotensis]